MKGLLILGGLVGAALLLAFALTRETTADIDRMFEDAVRERPRIEAALEECGDLVRYFSDIKPTERKKGELEELRRRGALLEKQATRLHEEPAPREEQKKGLAKIEEDFYDLRTAAEDLRARLREMKNFEAALRPRISKLGDRMQRLNDAQSKNADPEFQQRADGLIRQGKDCRLTAEGALKGLSVEIVKNRTVGMAMLNELDEILKQMDELLATFN